MIKEKVSLHNNSLLAQLASNHQVCNMCRLLPLETKRKDEKRMYILQTCDQVLGDGRMAFEDSFISEGEFEIINLLCGNHKNACEKCVDIDGRQGLLQDLFGKMIVLCANESEETPIGIDKSKIKPMRAFGK